MPSSRSAPKSRSRPRSEASSAAIHRIAGPMRARRLRSGPTPKGTTVTTARKKIERRPRAAAGADRRGAASGRRGRGTRSCAAAEVEHCVRRDRQVLVRGGDDEAASREMLRHQRARAALRRRGRARTSARRAARAGAATGGGAPARRAAAGRRRGRRPAGRAHGRARPSRALVEARRPALGPLPIERRPEAQRLAQA